MLPKWLQPFKYVAEPVTPLENPVTIPVSMPMVPDTLLRADCGAVPGLIPVHPYSSKRTYTGPLDARQSLTREGVTPLPIQNVTR